ncbi:ABC transporter ATP-binding protein [Acinetobacter bouvetii]|uniref:Galactose/methyl galactoside import ATP-binding protein MglA n=1 Tax=Acinetobacter bouvetii TaxID=202951 RepID=A0A811GGA8_9GAMM|nr:ABC transporter ATP-binding protein [Acinetobacter bouvetii]CAB1221650.1 Galactose/methyl galactoside import ATP-binding protein MglA [Acinetobacter bouvetii]
MNDLSDNATHIDSKQAAEHVVPRLELVNIGKSYNSLKANDQIDLKVQAGQIHAILGENGAGKSTLMKIIYGATQADQGQIIWNGKEVSIENPAAARKLGIGMVYQHFSLFETLTVAENILLGLDEKYDLHQLSQKIIEVSEQYGLPIDPRREVYSLSVGERQRVEIIRCLLQQPSLIILDEPTSVLTPQAVKQLFKTLKLLASQGVSILYISHKLHEIQELCDEATILRNGRVTGHVKPSEKTTSELARLMIGRELPTYQHSAFSGEQSVLLQVKQLQYVSDDPFGVSLSNIDLQLKAGEITGIAGISGNGQAELLALLSGEKLTDQGEIFFEGRNVSRLYAGERRDLGLGFVPEERLGRGAVPNMSLSQNAFLTAFRQGLSRFGLINFEKTKAFAVHCIEKFNVKAAGPQAEARSLSGGNLQKFIVGREILQNPKVLIVSQPTWGVDIGASMFIRQTLIDLSRQGVAILVISEELEELFEISDQLCVLASGKLSEPIATHSTNAEEIGLLMAGIKNNAATQAAAEIQPISV